MAVPVFHGQNVVASLKQGFHPSDRSRVPDLPRPKGRGHIESRTCRAVGLLAFLLCLGSTVQAQVPPVVKFGVIPEKVQVGRLVIISAYESTGDDFAWSFEDSPTFRSFGKEAAFKPMAAGQYPFKFTAVGIVDGKARMAVGTITVNVDGGPGPAPTPTPTPTPVPVPVPVPVPDPNPPQPPPTPTPTPQGKLRVMFVFESSDALDKHRQAALDSTQVKDYLKTHCDSEAGVYTARWWDKDTVTSNASVTDQWRKDFEAVKANTAVVPKVGISVNGGVMQVVPLPKNEADLLTLLRKYGGL